MSNPVKVSESNSFSEFDAPESVSNLDEPMELLISPANLNNKNVVIYSANDDVASFFKKIIEDCDYQPIRVEEPQIHITSLKLNNNQLTTLDIEQRLFSWADKIIDELQKHLNPVLLIQSELLSEYFASSYGVFIAELVWCEKIVPTVIAALDPLAGQANFSRRIRPLKGNPRIHLKPQFFELPQHSSSSFILWDILHSQSNLKEAIQSSKAAISDDIEIRLNTSKLLIEDEMEALSQRIRHRYQNVLASLRLLLGAFTSGDITSVSLQKAIEKLGNNSDDSIERLNELQKKWISKEEEIFNLSNNISDISTNQLPAKKGRIIIIDDEYFPNANLSQDNVFQFRNFSWQTVYDELLVNSRRYNFNLTPFDSYDKAIFQIDQELLLKTDLIILDVNLGDPSKSGLHLLHKIRLLDPSVPIIIMTSYDDAKICQFAFKWQADAFFAKQLQETGNRSSKKYYGKFTETIDFVLTNNLLYRELYKNFFKKLNFLSKIDDYVNNTNFQDLGSSDTVKTRLEDGIVGQMTHFFLLLRILDQRHRANKIKTLDLEENLDLLITLLLGAINCWLHFARPTDKSLVNIEAWFEEQKFDSEQSDPNVQALAKILGIHLIDRKNFIGSIRKYEALRHGAAMQLKLEEVCDIARKFFKLIEDSMITPSKYSSNQKKILKTAKDAKSFSDIGTTQLVVRAELKENSRISNHSMNSKMGAEAVLIGSYLEQIKETSSDIMVQDILDLYSACGPEDPAIAFIKDLEELCEDQNEKSMFISLKDENTSTPLMICLIDDHGAENGWAYVSQLIHNNLFVNNVEIKGASSDLDHFSNYIRKKISSFLFESALFFVDLKMPQKVGLDPTTDSGLNVINLIKTINPLAIVIVLSATSDSVNLRKAIANGAHDFFIKEIPGTTSAEFIEYAGQFSHLTEIVRISYEDGLFNKEFRDIFPRLERLIKDISSKKRTSLFNKKKNIELNFNKDLRKWLGLNNTSTDIEINLAAGRHLLRLIRRIIFLYSLSKEKYSIAWLDYFAAAFKINPQYLVHSQIWLSCGMLVEWFFNFVAFSLGIQNQSKSPGKRIEEEKIALISYLGSEAYDLGLNIWRRRILKGTIKKIDAADAKKQTFELVADSIKFINLIGLDLISPYNRNDLPNITDLRENLTLSQKNQNKRLKLQIELNNKTKLLNQYYSPDYPATDGDFPRKIVELEAQISTLEVELESLSALPILKTRHTLLSHLLNV